MRIHFWFCLTLVVCLFAQFGCSNDALGTGADLAYRGSDDLSGGCKTLTTESACRARTDCVADTCTECSCTPTFVGCRSANDTPTACPVLGCSQPQCCRNVGDCFSGSACQVPPVLAGCGAVPPPGPSACHQDSDCKTAGQICTCTPCTCGNLNQLECQDGCKNDRDCPEPQSCGADRRCHARACDSTCTGNYTCSGSNCVRTPCTKDAECGVPGYCVIGECSLSVGQCIPQSA